jgi:5-methylcytosine-specific restriction endonuclease McrA
MNTKPKYKVPDLVLVGFGRLQYYKLRCLKCGTQYFETQEPDLFCHLCRDLPHDQLQKFITDENYSDMKCLGRVVGWEQRIAATERRVRYNYKKVFKRDQFTCQYCGYNPREHPDFIPLWIDHVVPHSHGGSYRMDNLVVACMQCNTIASNKIFDTFDEKRRHILQRRLEKGYAVYEVLARAYALI